MIKIQLCPQEELENQYWWAADVAFAVAALFAAYIGVQYYLGSIQEKIDLADEKTASLKASSAALRPDIERFATLDQDIAALHVKIDALRKITDSKIARYAPVIVLEHLQNLKPDGLWLTSVTVGEAIDDNANRSGMERSAARAGTEGRDAFTVVGQAFDNLLVAELMTGIRATESQEKDEGDLRTQVSFKDLVLEETRIGRGGGLFPEMSGFPQFRLTGRFVDGGAKLVDAAPKAAPNTETKPESQSTNSAAPSASVSGATADRTF